MRILVFFSVLLSACASKKPPNTSDVLVENPPDTLVEQDTELPPFLSEQGLGPWRLGMSRFDVLTQGNCKDFETDRFTGGFSCPEWESPFGTTKVAFSFDRQYRLEKIELTLFDGENVADIRPLWAAGIENALRTIALEHAVESRTHPGQMSLTPEAFRAVLLQGARTTPFSMLFALEKAPESGARSWITVVASDRHLHGFLFVAR